MKPANIEGKHFGRLTAIERRGTTPHGKAVWLFRCDCGRSHSCVASGVITGHAKSCGCLQKEISAAIIKKQATTHGIGRTRFYWVWKAMLDRCNNPRNRHYKNYGGRGIRVCEFITQSPINLRDLIGPNPDNLTIDRSNNSGHYSCGKCRECSERGWALNVQWSSRTKQMRNMRRNRNVTIGGITKTLCEWSESTGIRAATIRSRIELGHPEAKWLSVSSLKEHHHKIVARLK